MTFSTTPLPRWATSAASPASLAACVALSAFCFTFAVISSMLDAVCTNAAACCSVRCDRSVFPEIGFSGELGGLRRAVGVLLHVRRHLVHARRGLYQCGGLLLGALRQVGISRCNLVCRLVLVIKPGAHTRDSFH